MNNTKFRSLTVSNTGELIGAAGIRKLFKANLINLHNAAVFFKFYDKATAGASTDTPVFTVRVPATDRLLINDGVSILQCALGMSVRVVTESADNGTTSPATLPIVELEYQ